MAQPTTQAERDTLSMLLWPDDREHIAAIRESSHGQMTISEAVRKALKLAGYLLNLPTGSRVLVVDADNKAKEIVII